MRWIFNTYQLSNPYEDSTVCRFFTGERSIPRKMVQYYADPNSIIPRCPDQLRKDVQRYVWCRFKGGLAYRQLNVALKDFCMMIPAVDRVLLVEAQDRVETDIDVLAIMWTRILWYSICCDIAPQYCPRTKEMQ